MKLVINDDWGGFSLSPEALMKCYEYGMTSNMTPIEEYYGPDDRQADIDKALKDWHDYKKGRKPKSLWRLNVFSPDDKFVLSDYRMERSDPILVRVVEELGSKAASGSMASLKVVEIPDDVKYYIHDYDGCETVHEEHRSWG